MILLRCVLFLIYISDKSRLQQYLNDGYKGKLDVTLLPDWEQLHVTEIFTPSILVCDEAKQNQEEEKYRKLGTFRDLFYKDDVLQKRVVLLGEAGAGKTTFSKHLTSVWCESSTLPQFTDVSVLEQFHYFFYVSCRFANKEESILDMIANQLFDNENMLKVAIHVLKNHPEDCFILIDGADEWEGSPTSETGRRGDKAGLPDMTGVADSVILITSRPWRFYALSKKTQNIFMRLKINGINDIGELTYRILEQLEDPDPRQSSSKFLRQVRENDMDELMEIPLICLIALGSWVDDHSLHKSMCINYINMLQTFIRRAKGQANWPSSENKLHVIPDLNDLEVKWEQQLNELPELLSKYKNLQRYAGVFLQIGHLAFDLLLRENKQSLVFSKAVCKSYLEADEENDESINVCLALGILSKTETTMRGLKKMENFAFCHKTFQEFFAALWLASKYENEKSKLHECIKHVDDLFDYEMLIIFLCGIDPRAGKQLWLYLAENVHDWQKEEKVQELVCKCMKQQEFNPIDQASDQIYFCIANLYITPTTSDEDVMLLRHVSEEYSCNVKSLHVVGENKVFGEKSVLLESLYRIMQHISSLGLTRVTITHHDLEQLLGSLSSCSCLETLYLYKVKCTEQSHSCCLDLQQHNKLRRLDLRKSYVKGLLLPVERDRFTSLWLSNVTINHQHFEQLSGSVSSYSGLVALCLDEVKCSEQSHSCCLPVLDLQKHNKLEELRLYNLSVEGLLLPVERDRLTILWLNNVTMNHQYLEQLLGSLSSYSGLVALCLDEVKCSEQSHSCCLPVLDLQKHNKLEELRLYNLSVEGLLLPVERDRLTILWLNNVTMNHQYLEQLLGSLSSYSCLEKLYLSKVKCSEQSHSFCLPVLDLQKHNKLRALELEELSVEGLLLPVERDMLTLLSLTNVTMNHQYLEQLSGSLSSYSYLENLNLSKVKCSEQSHSFCLPVLDLKQHNKLWALELEELSVEGLLLPVERDRLTWLKLFYVTMNHRGLEQLAGSLSSYSSKPRKCDLRMICSEHSPTLCQPVIDIRKFKGRR